MAIHHRARLAVACLAFLTAFGCGSNSPTSPSTGSTGAVISGVVTGTSPAMTVGVINTNLSTAVSAGTFQISDVPSGTIQLRFTGGGVNSVVTIPSVAANQFIEIRVQVNGGAVVIVDTTRTTKVSLCHKEGNGTYHLIDISVDAEAAHRAHGDAKIGEPVPGMVGKTFGADCKVQ